MSVDKPAGLQTTPLQSVHVETPSWRRAQAGPPAGSVSEEPTPNGIASDGVAPDGVAPEGHTPERPDHKHQAAAGRRSLPFTSVALVTAVGLAITQGVAVNLAITGNPEAAITIAGLLMWMTAIPFLLGLVGLVLGPHRGWAIVAMVASVAANPFLLRTILTFFGGLQ